jgi:hypothetical protein
MLDRIIRGWKSLGPLGPCAALFLGGCLFITGFVFDWKWLYPSRYPMRNYSPRIRRAIVLATGVILIVCSFVFYIYRDILYWH